MANAKFYFGPTSTTWWDTAADIETIDLLSRAVVVDFGSTRASEQAMGGDGSVNVYPRGGGLQVRIAMHIGEREDLAESLFALESHLKEGGLCSFTRDATEAWAVQVAEAVARGEAALTYLDSIFDTYESITDPVDAAHCILQSPPPELKREIVTVGSTALNVAQIVGRGVDAGAVYAHGQIPAAYNPILRPTYFYPFLRLLPGQRALVTQPDGTAFRFDARFRVDVEREHAVIGLA